MFQFLSMFVKPKFILISEFNRNLRDFLIGKAKLFLTCKSEQEKNRPRLCLQNKKCAHF